ncbi:MAG: Crp/Fnr family transcriptional regulator [Pleurocapsa sp.]
MQKHSQNNIEHRTFSSSELIPLETDFYWLVQQGIVKTCTWTEEGHPITLGYWGAKDIIGQPLSLVYPCQVKCLTKVQALSIPAHQAEHVSDFIHRHVQQTEELLYIMRSDKMYERLCKMLAWLGQKFGTQIEIGQLIDIHITHQDLAEIIGATRVTVTKLINQLEKEGFLSRPERNTIVLLNQ